MTLVASQKFDFIMSADDTTLVSHLHSFNPEPIQTISQNINKELNNINKWLNFNKLSINTNKSKHIIFKNFHKMVDPLMLQINYTNIQKMYFLGLTINKQLNWKDQTNILSNRCSRTIGALNKFKCYLPTGHKDYAIQL